MSYQSTTTMNTKVPSGVLTNNLSPEQVAGLYSQFQACRIRVNELEEQVRFLRHNSELQTNDFNAKQAQKSEFFLSLIKEMQDRHSKEVSQYQVQMSNYEMDKIKLSNLEHKMSEIGIGIEEIIQESKLLAKANEELERKIAEKDKILEQMCLQLQRSNQQIQEYQTRMENYQKLRLKHIKKSRDIGELILEAQMEISSLTPNEDNLKASVMMCASTGHKSSDCNHCKLANLEKKYSMLLS